MPESDPRDRIFICTPHTNGRSLYYFRVEPFSEGEHKPFDSVASPESVSVSLVLDFQSVS